MLRLERLAALMIVIGLVLVGEPRQWIGIAIGLVLGVILDRAVLDNPTRDRGRR